MGKRLSSHTTKITKLYENNKLSEQRDLVAFADNVRREIVGLYIEI